MQFRAAPAFSHSPALSPTSLLLGSAQGSEVLGGGQPYNFMRDLVQSRPQLLPILCQHDCLQNVANAPQSAQPVRGAHCVPGPELSCERGGGVWTAGPGRWVQHGNLFRKDDKRWKQMGAEMSVYFNFILSLVISARWTQPGAWNGRLTNTREMGDL